MKWSVEISEFDVEYHPRRAIKGQAITDFITEYTYDSMIEPKNKDE